MAKKSTYEHRKRGRKPPQLKKWIVFFLELSICLALIGFVGYRFYEYTQNSEKFQVKSVRIEGLRALSEDDVLEVSGLIQDGNVLYLDAPAIQGAIESMAFVKTCTVRQIFPDSVVISIDERIPYLTVQLNRRSYMIDEEGVVLLEYGSLEEPVMPFVTNVGDLEFVTVGEAIESESLHGAIQVWEAFRRLPLASGLSASELAAYSPSEILMYCDELVFEIRWSAKSVADQADRLSVFWDLQNGAILCGDYLDLRFGADLICK
ncbi:MAG: FtsQ-type POTRA domain-containing protein [Candidatus Hydrogenedentota bacterium]